MGKQLQPASVAPANYAATEEKEFVTMKVGGQLFGIPVMLVRDVLRGQKVARIPLAPVEVAGSLNLRGRIVTAIEMRRRLGMSMEDKPVKSMSVVVEHKGELFSLIVDSVGEVLGMPVNLMEKNPANLELRWKEISSGIFRLKEQLLIVIDVESLLNLDGKR